MKGYRIRDVWYGEKSKKDLGFRKEMALEGGGSLMVVSVKQEETGRTWTDRRKWDRQRKAEDTGRTSRDMEN